MTTPCHRCPLRRLALFDELSDDQLAFMDKFKSGELRVQPRTVILMEGARSPQLFTVLSGLGLRYKTLPNGRRQVLNFLMPGDFIGLQGAVMEEMQHSVEAVTEMTLCVFRRSELWTLFRMQPNRAFDLTWLVATEENFLGEALATIGQRSATERIAWASVRLLDRFEALGLARDRVILFPFRQQDLADTLGLSLVHTNKTLAKLKERKLVDWSEGYLTVYDPDELARIASVDREVPRRPLM